MTIDRLPSPPYPIEFRVRLDEDQLETAQRWARELSTYVAELSEWARRVGDELDARDLNS